MIYFIIFGLLIFVEVINILTNYKYRIFENIYFWIIGFCIFFIAAFRDGIGYDFYSYENIYYAIRNSSNALKNIDVELGYFLINKVSPNFTILIFIIALLGVMIKLFVINKYSDDKILSLIMYFSGVFIMFDMGVIRQGISITLGLISIKYILNKSPMKFFITIIIGSFFHISILVFIPLYFIGYKNYSRKTIYLTLFFILLLSFLDLNKLILEVANLLPFDIIKSKLSYYASIDTGNITLSLIKRISFMVFFVEFYKRKGINDKKSLLFLNSYFLSIIIMGIFFSIDILGGRGSMGLYMFQIFIFAIIEKNIKGNLCKFIILSLVVMLSVASMMGPIKHGATVGQPYLPYKSIFRF